MAISNTRVATIPTQVFLATGQQAVTTVIFCNVTTSTATLSFFAVPATGNAGPTTQVLNEIVLPGGETFSLDKERLVLENDDALYAQSDTNLAITVTVSSVSTE
jgi:hypothetical protein